MNERQVIDLIVREFRAMRLEPPIGLGAPHLRNPTAVAWSRAVRRIVEECQSDNRQAARTASIAGAMVTRGRTKL
jgi:hypothetical protein